MLYIIIPMRLSVYTNIILTPTAGILPLPPRPGRGAVRLEQRYRSVIDPDGDHMSHDQSGEYGV